MKILDLFSGIGGFSLGLERAGMETAAFCEIDTFCQQVLQKHWPDTTIYHDVRELEHDGAIDLICGGFPCQPFSVAGKRRGAEDDRHLWPEMCRLIAKHQPAWVIGENVAGLRSMGQPRHASCVESRNITRDAYYDVYEAVYTRKEDMLLHRICEDLEHIGYEVIPLIIPACAVGAPHRRDRLWIIAYNRCERVQRDKPESLSWESAFSWCKDVRRASDYFRLPNIPYPLICRSRDGVSRRVDRLKALGNAVVPKIPEIIGRAIMQIEGKKRDN